MVAPLFLLGAALSGGMLLNERAQAKARQSALDDYFNSLGPGNDLARLAKVLPYDQQINLATQVAQGRMGQMEQQRNVSAVQEAIAAGDPTMSAAVTQFGNRPSMVRPVPGTGQPQTRVAMQLASVAPNVVAENLAKSMFAATPKPEIKTIFGPDGRNLGARDINSPTVQAGLAAGQLFLENPVQKQGGDETFNNPVSEIDPATGKPIQVQYGNKGTRRVVENATPARQGNAFDRQDYWRGQFKPYLDSAQNALAQRRKVEASLKQGTGIGDIAAINAVQKQIDEGAVVRDQDVALITGAQSLIGRFMAADGSIRKGTVLTPQVREQLLQTSDALTKAIQEGAKSRIMPFVPTMQTEGVAFENIVPLALQEAYGWTGGPATSGNVIRFDYDPSGKLVPVQ